jgi:hypothetical protein
MNTTTINDIDSALSNAISALSAAQGVLRKSLAGRSAIDPLSKAFLGDDRTTRASVSKPLTDAEYDALVKANFETLADLSKRIDAIKAADAAPTYAIERGAA